MKNIVTRKTGRPTMLLREALKLARSGKEGKAIQYYLSAKDVMDGRAPNELERLLIDAVRRRIARYLGLACLP